MKKNSNKRNGLIFAGMGFELVAIVIAAQVLGEILDKEYGWGGLGQGGAIILGMIGWFSHLLILLKPFMEDSEDEAS